VGEANGWWQLIRVKRPGRQRGVTLVPYAEVAAHVRKQMKAA
jgi:hypothetical protein